QILADFEYFNDVVQHAVRVEKKDSKYMLSLPLSKDFWNDSALIIELNNLKSALHTKIGKEFRLILLHYEFSGETLEKEI
ncbi:MAG: hypothetical protein IAE98_13450, partial [Candidatus Kapabacteria bacterium]|nr:hypothetical protein [Candidatus Kapabacteria bacterium]